jgi:hypothetical protein
MNRIRMFSLFLMSAHGLSDCHSLSRARARSLSFSLFLSLSLSQSLSLSRALSFLSSSQGEGFTLATERRCTDLICIALFAGSWLMMLFIAGCRAQPSR